MPASARGASRSARAPGRSSMSVTMTSCSPRTTNPALAAASRAWAALSTSRWMIPSGPNCCPEQPCRSIPASLRAVVSRARVPVWYGRMNIRSFMAALPPPGLVLCLGPGAAGGHGDLQRDPQLVDALHLAADQLGQPLALAGGDLEHQLVVDLEDHAAGQPLGGHGPVDG